MIFSTIAEGWGLIFSSGDEALEGLTLMIKDFGNLIQTFVLDKINSYREFLQKHGKYPKF